MAEEKIRILVATDPCEKCKIKPCQRKCIFAEMYEKATGISRAEAVGKMAKAVYDTFSGCAHITPFEQVEDKYKQGYYKRAEAALNALLG